MEKENQSNKSIKTVLGENLKYLRKEIFRMDRKSFADYIGISQSTLSAFEEGKMIPGLEWLVSVSDKCHVSLDWLCGRSHEGLLKTIEIQKASYLQDGVRKRD